LVQEVRVLVSQNCAAISVTVFVIRHSGFVILSSFGFRHFVIPRSVSIDLKKCNMICAAIVIYRVP